MNTSKHSQQSGTKNQANAQPDINKPGAAGVLCKTFIHSPLSPLLYIVMLFLGIYGFLTNLASLNIYTSFFIIVHNQVSL